MNDLTQAIVSTLLCALLGMAIAESSGAPEPMVIAEHPSPGDTPPRAFPLA